MTAQLLLSEVIDTARQKLSSLSACLNDSTAFSSAAALAIILFYWLCGGFVAFSFVAFALSGLLYHSTDRFLYHPDQPATAR